ncbi:unnamed protein product [Microthlaspi erraticum]|uniref:Glycine-rich protein n=1 Tax=Microthlaspi erraticum TaxID=1685480 RepID=A0A6D2JP63_9BRAS|nr:unnamed protein product [Microthlaspi erraticum]
MKIMGLRKASLLVYFLFFLHLQHQLLHAIRISLTDLATVDPQHDNNLPVQFAESKPSGDAFAGDLKKSAVVVKKISFGGGGRSFGGGGRSFGGGGSGGSRGVSGGSRGGSSGSRGGSSGGERTIGGGRRGIYPYPYIGGGSHHSGNRSSGNSSSGCRESVPVWLGLSTLAGLVFVL